MRQWADHIVQDLRFTLRSWRKAPPFAIAAIVTLALGIGANTAIFSVVSGVLLRPLPFAHPEQLVQIDERKPPSAAGVGFDGTVVLTDLADWRRHSRLIESLASYTKSARNVVTDGLTGTAGDPEQVATVAADRELFHVLRVEPLAGRAFSADDPPNVAVASYDFWRAHFGTEAPAVGKSILVDGQSFTLIGVMPAGFEFPYGSAATGLWIPWDVPAAARTNPTMRLEAVVARLRPGASIEAARQELAGMEGPTQGGRIVRLKAFKEVVTGSVHESLLVLLGAVVMVLLVACVNMANLLMARIASREREIAMRVALGASRSRLVAQFLTESLLLALVAGAAAIAVGMLGSRLLVTIAAAQLPRAAEIGMDWRVFAFLLIACVTTGLAFGLGPAAFAARRATGGSNATAALKSLGVRSRVRDGLVVVELAVAFMLLTGAGLLLRTLLNLRHTDPGVNAENVVTAHVLVSGADESMALEERLSHIPGVRAAGLISLLPLQNSGWTAGFSMVGRPEIHMTELRFVTAGYFRAMGIPLRRGREFSSDDRDGSPRVIVVNEALVREYFPNEDVVGRTTDRGVIVGVIGDVRQTALNIPPKPEIFYSVAQNFAQMRRHGSTLVVRGSGSPVPLIVAIRAVVKEVSPSQALFRVSTMRDVIDESMATPRLYAWLVGVFAALAALEAIAGIYGVIAYVVALRTREFGIRMALGADTRDVLGIVLRRGATLTGLGLAGGLAGAVVLTRVLRSALYDVSPVDAATFGATAIILATTALAACVIPARRAARIEPHGALRVE